MALFSHSGYFLPFFKHTTGVHLVKKPEKTPKNGLKTVILAGFWCTCLIYIKLRQADVYIKLIYCKKPQNRLKKVV